MISRFFALTVLLIVTTFSSLSLFGSDQKLITELKDQTFKAKVLQGFHFNEKAPNLLILDGATFKPSKLSGREAEFINLPKNWAQGKAALYICDKKDKK